MESLSPETFTPLFSSHLGEISSSNDQKTIVLTAASPYLPFTDLANLLGIVLEIARQGQAETFIFDKKAVRVLKSQSVDWYYNVWMKEMDSTGLRFRVVLPEEDWLKDAIRQTVSINPALNIESKNSLFFDTLEEALAS